MVLVPKMGWLSGFGDNIIKRSVDHRHHPSGSALLGILAFETAKTMSRLLSLYKSLDENETSKLKQRIVISEGVSYLNSKDQGYLLTLACTEMIEDLDKAAATVARLGRKCSDFGLNRFDLVYTDLKLGIIDFGKLEYGSKQTEKMVEKLEKLIRATSSLYASLEALSELEVSEKKLKQWKQNHYNNKGSRSSQPANYELFEQRIAYQRKQVRHFRETSMWNQTFDKIVGMLARVVCIVYARICDVFGPHVGTLPHVLLDNIRNTKSGPIPSTSQKTSLVRFHSQKSILFSGDDHCHHPSHPCENKRVFHAAGPTTVGGCGLALRYANVILLAERYLDSAVSIGEDARDGLYQMLPQNLKLLVHSKLKKRAATAEDNDDTSLSEGWREALMEILRWLGPVANDTVKWHEKKNFDKMKFDSKPTVLLMHTLHFSDKEKAEAAIAEVLVGLSCVYKYENRWNVGGNCSDGIGEGLLIGRCSFDGIWWS